MDNIKDRELLLLSKLNSLYFDKFGDAYKQTDRQDDLLYRNQIRAIMTIGNRKISASSLGKQLCMRKSSITSLVDSLLDKGFIEKKPDENDRRKCVLSLSEKGMGYREDKYNKLHVELRKILETLSEEDTKKLFESLSTITDILNKL